MNIDRKVLVLASFPAIMLGGCNFNEDFCIREGELVAWCDFSGIKEKPPVPQERHNICGQSTCYLFYRYLLTEFK